MLGIRLQHPAKQMQNLVLTASLVSLYGTSYQIVDVQHEMWVTARFSGASALPALLLLLLGVLNSTHTTF